MNVISTEKTEENFWLIYDTKAHFALHHVIPEEAKYKTCKVRKIIGDMKRMSHLFTHDVHTIHYPDLLIKWRHPLDWFETDRVADFTKFDTGNLCVATRGANLRRIGMIINRERHPLYFDIVSVNNDSEQW